MVIVGWGMAANHGGGYQYRLCKIPAGGKKDLTEECFQQTPLKFHGDVQWTQEGQDTSTKKVFPAMRTTEGTFPPGKKLWVFSIFMMNSFHDLFQVLNGPEIPYQIVLEWMEVTI